VKRDTMVVVGLLVLVGVLLVARGAFTSETLLRIGVIIPAIILHEVAHGAVALALGDDTAQRAGRLTLNPIKHIDPFGTIILPALLALSSLGMIGYAKPVPVNTNRLRHPRNDSLVVSLAGPATNLGLAALSLLWLRFVVHPDFFQAESTWPLIQRAVLQFGLLNVALAVFNMLPIPPLDGSAVVERVLPDQWRPAWHKFRQYGLALLLIVVLLRPTAMSGLFNAAYRVWLRALAG
jgi:Zn-dependent protease